MKFFALIAFIAVTAKAEILEIRISGKFLARENADFFSPSWPVLYDFTLRFDTVALDIEPDLSQGVYQSPFQPFSLVLSTGQIYTGLGTEVRVYSDYLGVWGFVIGPAFKFVGSDGLQVDPYETNLKAFGSFQFYRDQTPTDELQWLSVGEHQSDGSYFKLTGTMPGTSEHARIQDTTLNSFTVYSVTQVPEIDIFGMYLTGLVILFCNRCKRPIAHSYSS
jgi:hypothetical protein